MPTRTSTPRLTPLLLAAGIALALAGCVPLPPPLPTAQPPIISDPVPPEPTPSETNPVDPPPEPEAGAIPALVDLGTVLEVGTQPGWETSILTDSAFTVQPDSDFPAGPTIHVLETATGCTFWAYQGQQDIASTDETENTEATLASLTGTSPDDWDADPFELDASTSQGVAVMFLSIFDEQDDGSTEAFFARNFQSSRTTSSIIANCGPGAGGIDHIDEVVLEHFQINFLQP